MHVIVCVCLQLCGMCRGVIHACLQGKLTFKSGTRKGYKGGDAYEGEFKDDKRNGQVRWLTPTPFCRTLPCAGF